MNLSKLLCLKEVQIAAFSVFVGLGTSNMKVVGGGALNVYNKALIKPLQAPN